MRIEYSPINDLYGVAPRRRQPRQRSNAWLIALLVFAGVFFFESIRPVKRLRATAPSDFVHTRPDLGSTKATAQEQVARSYWDVAVEFVQKSYPFGSSLPSTPPSDFRLEEASQSGVRTVYWEKLREMWNRPEVWNTSFEWRTDWVQGEYNSLVLIANK
ncbi:MAG TPA: hypothetical protein VMW54_10265 [Terriglobia bacterium]|nr:hypothetical protein [Terriglobia bacterium]